MPKHDDKMGILSDKLAEADEAAARARKLQKLKRKKRQAARGLTDVRVGDPMVHTMDEELELREDDPMYADEEEAGVAVSRQEMEEGIAETLGIPSRSAVRGSTVPPSIAPGIHAKVAGMVAPLLREREKEMEEELLLGMLEAEEVSAPVELGEYKEKCSGIVREFLSSEDFEEAGRSVLELGAPFFMFEFVRRLFLVTMDNGERGRELGSRLLSWLYGAGVIKMEAVGKAMERLFETMEDLKIDHHDAERLVGTFLARAVADDVLPPVFVMDPAVEAVGKEAVAVARALLSQPHALQRLETCWGSTAVADVAELKHAVKLAVEEFFDTGDAKECRRCLAEMRARHFLHEAVKRCIVLALSRSERERTLARALVRELVDCGLVTENVAFIGFRRVREEIPDLELDVPGVRPLFDQLVLEAIQDGVLPEDVDLTPRFHKE